MRNEDYHIKAEYSPKAMLNGLHGYRNYSFLIKKKAHFFLTS